MAQKIDDVNIENAVKNVLKNMAEEVSEDELSEDETEHIVSDAVYIEAYKLVERMSFQDALLFLANKSGWAEDLFSELHNLMSDITDYTKERITDKI